MLNLTEKTTTNYPPPPPNLKDKIKIKKIKLQVMTSKNDASSPTKDTHQEATAASLSEKAQQIVSDLNSKRKQDTEILTELKTTLLSHVMLSKKLVHNTKCLMSVVFC